MKILCKTTFDISATGSTGQYKSNKGTFYDLTGNKIDDQTSWNRSRNQQRNWETVTQLISLRTQVEYTFPTVDNGIWSFNFDIDNDDLFRQGDDQFKILKDDANGTPMLVGLSETLTRANLLECYGPDQNIWFEQLNTLS